MALIDLDVITILSGAALSGALNLGDKTICGFYMPAVWTAAAMSFQVSNDGGTTWLEYYDSKAALSSWPVVAVQFIAVDPVMFRGVNCIKFRSGTSATPVNQGADRLITVVSRRAF